MKNKMHSSSVAVFRPAVTADTMTVHRQMNLHTHAKKNYDGTKKKKTFKTKTFRQ